jgi:hypothetical protein
MEKLENIHAPMTSVPQALVPWYLAFWAKDSELEIGSRDISHRPKVNIKQMPAMTVY